MLLDLSITNFAIIDQLNLRLEPGLNVLTGETGAGKSIVIDAVTALLGGKGGAELVRVGAEQARVEAIFDLPSAPRADGSPLLSVLQEYGLDEGEGALIVSRETSRSGRSVGRINGRAVPAGVLQQVGRELLDIHGQSEHLSLLRVSRHVDLLDEYAGHRELRGQVAAKVAQLRQTRRELQNLLQDERELARRMDLLRFQVDEIQSAGLRVEEESEIESERVVLANAEALIAGASAAYNALYEGLEQQRAVVELLGEVQSRLAEVAGIDPSANEFVSSSESLLYQAEELARSVRAYRDRIECDPARLQEIEERLDLIHRLKRKYGSSMAEVLKFGETAAAESASLAHAEERVGELQDLESALLGEIGNLAEALSQQRKQAAATLAEAMERELADLNMAKSRFAVSIEQVESPDGVGLSDGRRCAIDATGIDKVEFLISPNPGEPLKPLARIASGGETARLMLALKTILSRVDPVPTLIFDEIDQGIGGRSGQVVGKKLWNLTAGHQVICVTHLPQIACFGDAHYSVAKGVSGERTTTRVRRLASDERVDELAAMLGGASGGQGAKQNGREMLDEADAWKSRPAGDAAEYEQRPLAVEIP